MMFFSHGKERERFAHLLDTYEDSARETGVFAKGMALLVEARNSHEGMDPTWTLRTSWPGLMGGIRPSRAS